MPNVDPTAQPIARHRKSVRAPRRVTVLLAACAALLAATRSRAADPPVVSLDEALAAHADPAKGAAVTEILRGEQASVNAWQITDAMPPHLHREHEEVIIVRTGRARARIGDRDVDLKPGDVFVVPKNTVHAARAYGEEPFTGVSVFAPAFDGKDRVPVPAPEATR
jgi:mannose-6-phosphate isomerase-like protein (cupin superfamily)